MDWNDEKYFPHGKEDDEEDGDDDDYYEDEEDEEDENDEEDDNNPLTNPLKKSSDPFIRFRKIFRRFRRRRRPGSSWRLSVSKILYTPCSWTLIKLQCHLLKNQRKVISVSCLIMVKEGIWLTGTLSR